jgi:phosphinothricin acetyltransferase
MIAKMKVLLRDMYKNDIVQVNEIYNMAIDLDYATAHKEKLPPAYHKSWYEEHKKEKNPIIVAYQGDEVLGWNSLSYYRAGRGGLASVRETSYYVRNDVWNKGIASMLMEETIARAKTFGIDTLVTFIMDVNRTSVHLMNKFGFEEWGRLPEVLCMRNGKFDHLIFGKKI